jgi:hypothetical protein
MLNEDIKEVFMRIDRERLNALSSLDDAALWLEITKMARGIGLNLPSGVPKSEDMRKIRSLLSEGKINPMQAMKILSSYKKEIDRGR